MIIIGAGIYGLVAAKTYLQINPKIDLTIIDGDSSVGGVWSKSRVYPGLLVDSPSPSFEFSDLKIEDEFGIPNWSDLTGEVMAEYTERYARKFDILRHCKLNTHVTNIERDGKGWRVHMRPAGELLVNVNEAMTCDVLIVATGLFSKPNIPDVDTSAFTGLFMHSKDLRNQHAELAEDTIKSVVVVGGNKSSVEAVSACALAGKKVHWLIRKDGAGPTLLMNARMPNGQSGFKPVVCRWAQFNIPTIYRYRGLWDWFFSSGKSSLGNKAREWFWDFLTRRGLGDRYEKSEKGQMLKPDVCNIFWTAGGLAVAHDPELKLFDIINNSDMVQPARLSISSIQGNTFTLSDDSKFEADALVFATGWLPASTPVFSAELKAELGFPMPLDSPSESEVKYWKGLDASANAQIFSMYPMLASPPSGLKLREEKETQIRQLRTIIPTSLAAQGDRSIIFLGQLSNTQHFYFAETSALWGVAYLERLHVQDQYTGKKSEMDKEVALHNAFMKRRYPGRRNVPFAVLEIRDWMDVMLKDLGVRTDRNRLTWERENKGKWSWFGWKPWLAEWFQPYLPAAYRGIVDELLERAGEGDDKHIDT